LQSQLAEAQQKAAAASAANSSNSEDKTKISDLERQVQQANSKASKLESDKTSYESQCLRIECNMS